MPPSKKLKLKCCVPNCDTVYLPLGDRDSSDVKVKLYKFPSDKPILKKWVSQIGRGSNFVPTKTSRICSKHFQTGRRSYKSSHVDYIPNIFWYNTTKSSEFCGGCRRKLCKCGVTTTVDSLLDVSMPNEVQLRDSDTLRVTPAPEPPEDPGPEDLPDPTESGNSDDSRLSTTKPNRPRVDTFVVTIPIRRTAFDETIDSCVRGEDSVGDMLVFERRRPSEPTMASRIRNKMGTLSEMRETASVSSPVAIATLSVNAEAVDPSLDNSVDLDLDPTVEADWKRRERNLIKKHKDEEKKLVSEIIRNNQAKNQIIEQLRAEIRELKRAQKQSQCSSSAVDKKIRTEYESLRQSDIKSILDEANSNLTSLQARWTEEKRVLVDANAALARLCQGEIQYLDGLQAEFMCSVITACSTPLAGIGNVTQGDTSSLAGSRPLTFESCSGSDETLHYFTGIPTVDAFTDLFTLVESNANSMSYWNGKSWIANSSSKNRQSGRIDLKNRLFMTLTRYRRGYDTRELGFFFNCDLAYVTCLFVTFSKLLENDLVSLFLRGFDYPQEFSALPEIVQSHYSKLYGTLRLVEIHLGNQSKSKPSAKSGSYKLLVLCSPSGNLVFISTIFPTTTSDRDVILDSNVLQNIPAGSQIFVEQEFDVGEECLAKSIQLLVFPQEYASSKALGDDDPWEIKLLVKCKSKIDRLLGQLRSYVIFDNGIHLHGTKAHMTMVIRVALLLQHYIDTCTVLSPPPQQPWVTVLTD